MPTARPQRALQLVEDDAHPLDDVALAQSGDRAAFGRLYPRYVRLVHGILLTRVPATDALDLVQDVFVAALDRLDHLDDASRFGPWLAAIALSTWLNWKNRATSQSTW